MKTTKTFHIAVGQKIMTNLELNNKRLVITPGTTETKPY